MPLTVDLAPPQRRATYISIVLAGLLTGVLFACILSGIIAQYTSYRNIYWTGVAGMLVQSDSVPTNPSL
jgi:predicted MFS family arabinose efflux permease